MTSSDPRLDQLVESLEAELEGTNETVYSYLSKCYHTLNNINLTIRHDYDVIGLDSSSGLAWLILVPLMYFLWTSLVLGIILVAFWYAQRGSSGWTGRSSFSTPSRSMTRDPDSDDGGFNARNVRPAGVCGYRPEVRVVDNDAVSAWSVRSSIRTSRKNTTEENLRVALEAKMGAKTTGSLRSVDILKVKRLKEVPVKESNSLTSTLTISSDSLEGQVAVDLKSSMESQKLLWSPNGELKPDALYLKSRCNVAVQADVANFLSSDIYNSMIAEPGSRCLTAKEKISSFEFVDGSSNAKNITGDTSKNIVLSPEMSISNRNSSDKENFGQDVRTATRIFRLLNDSGEYQTLDFSGNAQKNQFRGRAYKISQRPCTPLPSALNDSRYTTDNSLAQSTTSHVYENIMPRTNTQEKQNLKLPAGYDYPDIVSMERCPPPSRARTDDSSPDTSFTLPQVTKLPDFYHWVESPMPYPGELITPIFSTRTRQANSKTFDALEEASTEASSTRREDESLDTRVISEDAQIFRWPSNDPSFKVQDDEIHHKTSYLLNFKNGPYQSAKSYTSRPLSQMSPAYSTSQLEIAGATYRSGWGPVDSEESWEDSSDDSVSVSSSISKFHASKQGGNEVPRSRYPISSSRTITSSRHGSVSSSLTGEQLTENTSTCPNHGSITHSSSVFSDIHSREAEVFADHPIREVSCSDYLEVSACVSGLDNSGFVPDAEEELINEASEVRENPAKSYNIVKKHQVNGIEDIYVTDNDRKQVITTSSNSSRCSTIPDVVQSGRVSTKERLYEFGFIKLVGNKKYVINPSPGKFFRRSSSRSSRSSSMGSKTVSKAHMASVVKRLNVSPSPRSKFRAELLESTQLLSEPRPVKGKPPRVPRFRALST